MESPLYHEKLSLLEEIVESGLSKLLDEAKSRGYSEPPFGRPANPTPLMTEEQFLRGGGLQDVKRIEDGVETHPRKCSRDPVFNYEYGFNPLKFLANYIKWAHPESRRAREEEKAKALCRLNFRANHAQFQLKNAAFLSIMRMNMESGIMWGPFTSPTSPTSIVAICKPIRSGIVTFQISTRSDFEKIDQEIEINTSPPELSLTAANLEANEDGTLEEAAQYSIPAVKLNISNLSSNRKYFIRVCLKDDEKEIAPGTVRSEGYVRFIGKEGKRFQQNSFYTLPSEVDSMYDEEATPLAGENDGNTLAMSDKEPGSTMDETGATQALHSQQNNLFYIKPVTLVCLGYSNGGEEEPSIEIQNMISPHLEIPYPVTTALEEGHDRYPTIESNANEGIHPPSSSSQSFSYPVDKDGNHFRGCIVGCVLGELLSVSPQTQTEQEGIEQTSTQIWKMYRRCGKIEGRRIEENVDGHPLFRDKSVIIGWNDTRFGCDMDMRAEEIAFRQYEQDLKKYHKKFGGSSSSSSSSSASGARAKTNLKPMGGAPLPVFSRPPMSPSLAALAQGFAVNINEEGYAVRNIYRSAAMGPHIQVFVLDGRRGYFGKQQIKWLREELKNCKSLWKLVLTGPSLGYNKVIDTSQKDGICNRPISNIGTGAVQMQLPEPAELDDTDEQGRSKTSLGYVVTSLQRHAEKCNNQRDQNGNEGDNGGERDIDKKSDEDMLSGDTIDPTDDDEEVEGHDGAISIESGIVFISGGVCTQPFIATYDPCRWGRPFAAEVGVGAALLGTPSNDETCHIEQAPELNPTILFEVPTIHYSAGDIPSSQLRYSGSASLREDGALALRICREAPNGGKAEVISDIKLKCSRSF